MLQVPLRAEVDEGFELLVPPSEVSCRRADRSQATIPTAHGQPKVQSNLT